jgi:DNA-binding CsgD family transcriptional regulator
MGNTSLDCNGPETGPVDLREREKELDFVYSLAALLSGSNLDEGYVAGQAAELFRNALTRPDLAQVQVHIHDFTATSPAVSVMRIPGDQERMLRVSAGEAEDYLLLAFYPTSSVVFSDRERALGVSAARLLAISAKRMISDHDDATLKRDLERKNTALSELLSRIELEKKSIRDNIASHLKDRVLPILSQMDKAGVPGKWSAELRRELGKAVSGQAEDGLSLRSLLSSRELEICSLVAAGLSSKEIAGRLGLAAATVERHRHNARRKLGLPARQGSLGAVQLGSDL